MPLDLETPDPFSRDQFIATPALQAVLDVLLAPEHWLSAHLILLGPASSGKTHMGHIFADMYGARFLSAQETQTLDPAEIHDTAYVIDEADQASEEILFHLSNHVHMSGHQLVLLTKKHPRDWRSNLPDLASRLNAMRLLILPEPDEDLLIAILNKLFAQRAISPSPDCIDYLARRMDRSVKAAQKIVTDIEHYANGRAFNRALARDFMDRGDSLPLPDMDDTRFDSF